MDKDLKLYYSISEVAQMFDVNESLLRFLGERVSTTFSQKGKPWGAAISQRGY